MRSPWPTGGCCSKKKIEVFCKGNEWLSIQRNAPCYKARFGKCVRCHFEALRSTLCFPQSEPSLMTKYFSEVWYTKTELPVLKQCSAHITALVSDAFLLTTGLLRRYIKYCDMSLTSRDFS